MVRLLNHRACARTNTRRPVYAPLSTQPAALLLVWARQGR
jgi:hypothetical protein